MKQEISVTETSRLSKGVFKSSSESRLGAPKSVFFRLLVIFTITLLFIGELTILRPDGAEAGVLSSSSSSGPRIRAPRARNRSVRSTTAVMRATGLNLKYSGTPYTEIYSTFQKEERKYFMKLARWERKVERILEKDRRRKEKEAKAAAKRLEKQNRYASVNPKSKSAPVETSISTDPTAWFKQKIARVDEGGSLRIDPSSKQLINVHPETVQDVTSKNQEVKLEPKKSIGFWGHIRRALTGM